jgi:hypothetical protein
MITFLEGMGPRQSMAVEILDTIRFGALDRIKGANGYRKQKLDKGDAYVIPFGLSKDCYGAVLVKAPKNLEVQYMMKGKRFNQSFKYASEVKSFLVKKFIQET